MTVATVIDTILRGLFFYAVMYGLWKVFNWAPKKNRDKPLPLPPPGGEKPEWVAYHQPPRPPVRGKRRFR